MSIPQSGGGQIEDYTDLAGYLAAGCKAPDDWRIGTEHEKFGYRLADHLPLPYEGDTSILAMLSGLRDRFGWAPVEEAGKLIGLEKDGANVSLEPGGQLELSGATLRTIHETCDEVNSHLHEVKSIADEIGAGFIGLGAAPEWTAEQMPVMPKGRYALMTRYMREVGSHGTQMMYRTCTIQVNLDFASEADMVKKFRVGLALQPLATALFASSPFFEAKVNGWQSWRARIWRDTDPARTGMLPFVFEEGMGFERYVDYALDVPMYFVYRDGRYIDALGQSFRDFLAGKLPALPGERPMLSDWADHLTTIFPEVRIKRVLEVRNADAVPPSLLCAMPALWKGLLYDADARAAAAALARWTVAERDAVHLDVARRGLGAAGPDGTPLGSLARELVAVAREGLRRQAHAVVEERAPAVVEQRASAVIDETGYVEPLEELLARGTSPGEDILARWQGDWEGRPDRLIEYARY
jgi:glutamate--cysteine ligase